MRLGSRMKWAQLLDFDDINKSIICSFALAFSQVILYNLVFIGEHL